MSTLNIPVYKTEAGVHTAVPAISSFSTTASVGGVLTAKKGTEVMIKFISGSWVEQSVYSSGTKFATKTVNPANGNTAYLQIPITDYNALASCCFIYTLGGGTGGSTSGGRVDYLTGVTVDEEAYLPKMYTGTFSNVLAAAPIFVYVSGNMQIDMGDGVFRTYPQGVVVTRTFADGDDPVINVKHDDTPTNLSIGDDAGGFRGVLSSITGDIPTGLTTFQTSNSLPNLPALPTTVKSINISLTTLNTAKLNTLLDALIAAGLTNGSFSALTNPRADATLVKLQTLQSRSWFVQAYGIYPNL